MRYRPFKADLSGRVALVTGANSGMGKETARELARMGAEVILGCRSGESGGAARSDIVQTTGSDQVSAMAVDLSTLASVQDLARGVRRPHLQPVAWSLDGPGSGDRGPQRRAVRPGMGRPGPGRRHRPVPPGPHHRRRRWPGWPVQGAGRGRTPITPASRISRSSWRRRRQTSSTATIPTSSSAGPTPEPTTPTRPPSKTAHAAKASAGMTGSRRRSSLLSGCPISASRAATAMSRPTGRCTDG